MRSRKKVPFMWTRQWINNYGYAPKRVVTTPKKAVEGLKVESAPTVNKEIKKGPAPYRITLTEGNSSYSWCVEWYGTASKTYIFVDEGAAYDKETAEAQAKAVITDLELDNKRRNEKTIIDVYPEDL